MEVKKARVYTSAASASTPRATLLGSVDAKTKEVDKGKKNVLDDRTQEVELLCVVEVIRKEHGKEVKKL